MFQDAVADPILKKAGGPGVRTVSFAVLGRLFTKDYANQIVRAQGEIPRLHVRRDLVVRLRYQVLYRPGLCAVAIGLKREDACQRSGYQSLHWIPAVCRMA